MDQFLHLTLYEVTFDQRYFCGKILHSNYDRRVRRSNDRSLWIYCLRAEHSISIYKWKGVKGTLDNL